MYWIYPLPRECLAEIEKRHIVETCFTSHNKWFMFGPQLTPQGNNGRVICNAYPLYLIMLFGRQHYVALLCVGLRSLELLVQTIVNCFALSTLNGHFINS